MNKLQDAAQQLSRDERHRLGDLVMEWEEKYGKSPNLSPVPTAEPATAAPSAEIKPLVQQPRIQPAQPQNPPAFGTRMLDPTQIAALMRQVEPPVSCPHCGRPNPGGSTICRFCGQLLQAKVAAPTRQLDDTGLKKATLLGDFFSSESTLVIQVRGYKGALEAFPRDKMIIGRGFSPVQGQPFLDLSPFDGEALGVSRYHAEIRFLNNTLVITDLDSDNGTFINEMRLYPYEIRVLHNNDELRVGKLAMKVSFKQAIRR
ncbi:MAG: FHA domain-containing protein [Aggregatilineales bacterium]